MEKEYDVIVAGHICLDMIPGFADFHVKELSKLFVPGKLIEIDKMVVSTGGVVSNTGLNLKKLGMKVVLMGKIGDDPLGKIVLDILNQREAEKDIIISKGEGTSYTIVLAPPGIDRIFLHNTGANNTFSSDDIDYNKVKKAYLFHLGYPTVMKLLYSNNGAELINIYKKVKEMDVITSMDVTLPDLESEGGKADWKGILKNLLPYIDIFIPNIEEAMFILNREKFIKISKQAKVRDAIDLYKQEEIEDLSKQFLELGVKIICLKAGHKGSYCRTASAEQIAPLKGILKDKIENWSNRELWKTIFEVSDFGSATGAGDSFTAGFLAAFIKEHSIEDALKIATCVGAQCVSSMDALTGVKTWDETVKMMDEMKLVPMKLGKPWTYDKKNQIWVKP